MNLLKQTALILGLTSLVIGGWAIYRHWQSKISILFSLFCFVISIWALSFVAHATLHGRLSHDIHEFCNIWLVPIAIGIISQIIFKKRDRFSQILQIISIMGAAFLGAVIGFSMPRGQLLQDAISFYPTLILIEYAYVIIQDLVLHVPMNTDLISPSKKIVFYLGLVASLIFCTFDHVPALGYTIPALGNLLLTLFLGFSSQVITPQKLLRIEALVSRFFAIVILALIITGFFALLYPYISETFALFLLNSFLISFAVLALWSPLVTFFRYLGRQIHRSNSEALDQKVENLRQSIAAAINLEGLQDLVVKTFQEWMQSARVKLVYEIDGVSLPRRVRLYFKFLEERNTTPVLHRDILILERDQMLSDAQKLNLDLILKFLDKHQCDIVFPVFYQEKVIMLVLIQWETAFNDWSVSLSRFSKLYDALQELGPSIVRLTRVREEKEKDRLVLLGEMAAGLAHEIRNPLGAIRGAAELIPDPSSPWARMIREEVDRLNRLVSQFLDFAQDPKQAPEVIELNEGVQTALQHLKLALPKDVDIKLQLASLPVPVLMVPDHLQQVLLNLLQNAVKATSSTKIAKISVQVFTTGFSISDNGTGMSEDVKSKVFQPFFTFFKEGTGLGLSICQRLVIFNGGRIEFKSEPGRGTEVSVHLAAPAFRTFTEALT
ncbi:MAG: hypothetical protein H7333_02845 [Bdellovibrionales bacterium]|nr:hypothetical protein [Oligoflexia bacterium]